MHRTFRSVLLSSAFLALSVFAGGESAAVAGPVDGTGRSVSANGVGTPFELSFWESVAKSEDPAQYQAYLEQYPDGTFARLAQAKIRALTPAPQPAVVPTVAAPPAFANVIAPPIPVAMPVAAATTPAAPLSTAIAPVAAPPLAPTTPIAAPPAKSLSLLEQMAAVGNGPVVSTPALFTETGPVPPRPALTEVAIPAIPDHFCSAVERNSFHDSVYVPAVAQADRNNEATIAHLRNVQALHAQALAANNVAGANALAHEATDFKPVADTAYQTRTTMADLFNRIMAAPITKC